MSPSTTTACSEGKKNSWKIGSSFALKKPAKFLLKDNLDDDLDLIDEDSLLTEDDLKKPQVPAASGCETPKKACKNCVCGRDEIERKAVKLGLTEDQIENPQSSCGSISFLRVCWSWCSCLLPEELPLKSWFVLFFNFELSSKHKAKSQPSGRAKRFSSVDPNPKRTSQSKVQICIIISQAVW
ncbi:hypothetical protein ISN45_At05g017290 [Arabidopsis thaliana x Arabidopsis arenosa]|uniref:Uncharacterized protein n=1 Tax=Arabidopsis thaliana x Arabidopsis arenosa TaxID=1240361 RepID=A0A8T2CTB1_9BRAS|nr:hypothetical protein ISN45_At05g017290 [Arabidopsis thaliana x Arabidopsis arenosa]